MSHVALLGDSIFDNASYTSGEPDVATHLRSLLTSKVKVTLAAVDGAMTSDLPRQLTRLPSDVDRYVVSIGGNDALMNSDLLAFATRSSTEALSVFADRIEAFERSYRSALGVVLNRNVPTTVCTVYNGNLEPAQARIAIPLLMMFNDTILRVAFEFGLDVIELRRICREPADYANPIEPSGTGGLKIARAIAKVLATPAQGPPQTRVFPALSEPV